MLSNFEKFKFYMKDKSSPESFIDFSYYAMIGCALQRRVWMGDNQLFPNPYIILVGPPAVGKGIAIDPVKEMLSFFKMNHPRAQLMDDPSVEEVDGELFSATPSQRPDSRADEKLLFPQGPDASTYESLVAKLAKSAQHICYPKWNEKLQKNQQGIYLHSSVGLCLSELSSMFQCKTENLVNFLVAAYDSKDYRKETKYGATDKLINPCLTLLGGTQPHFMQKIFDSSLLTEGFASRAWFIYEYAPRFVRWEQSTYSSEQLQAKEELLQHLKSLSRLYGKCQFTPEAEAYMKNWFEVEHQKTRPNTSLKLEHYYGRKNIHVRKMSMILHFSECVVDENGKTDMNIGLDVAQRSLKVLAEVERKMHYALSFGSTNPLAQTAKKIIKHLSQVEFASFWELLLEFNEEVREQELREVIKYLEGTNQIGYETKDKDFLYYKKGKKD